MLRKLIGIIGIIVVVGTIVMVALSPRTEGFFPGMFDFLKHTPQTETGTISAPRDEARESIPVVVQEPVADTLLTEPQNDTIILTE